MAGERGRGRRLPAMVVHDEEEAAARAGWKSPGSLKEAEQIDCSCLIVLMSYNWYL